MSHLTSWTYDLDCKIFKYPRTEPEDDLPEIPSNIHLRKLTDKQVFEVDGAKVTVIHTPGHTTDHVVLKTDDGVLFSGDCILGKLD